MSKLPSNLPELVLSQVAESPFAWVITRAEDGVIVYVNEAAVVSIQQLYGVAEPLGRSVFELGYHNSVTHRAAQLERARRQGGHLRRNDLRRGDVHVEQLTTSHAFRHDGVEYVVANFVDLSMVIEGENALGEALERLEKAQAIAMTGDFVAELNSREFNGSAEALRILGFPHQAATISTNSLFKQFHPDDRPAVRDAMRAQVLDGAFAVEHRLRPDIDGDRWVYAQGKVETAADGRQLLRGTVQDITERKRQELERRRLEEKLRETQKLEGLGVLAGGIAHDFNNMLAGMLGNAELALLSPKLPREVAARLEDIVKAATRAADLTRQLLAYAGKGRFVIETLDLSTLIREMMDLLEASVSRQHRLELELAEALPAVEVDATQIRQIVMNLVINAAEAIDHDAGVITVRTGLRVIDGAAPAGDSPGGEVTPGQYVCLEVSDNGVGMAPATTARVFEPFFTTKFTGRGLGLAAAVGIARGHQGAIGIRSAPGEGTTFNVLLPAVDDVVAPPRRDPVQRENWHGSGCVLVIDDDAIVRDFCRAVLERFGYEVLTAAGGAEGLACLARPGQSVDLVLLDLTMPQLDGSATFTRMQAQRPGIPTILMSGYDEQDATQAFAGRSLVGFLAKPFAVADLMALVDRVLGTKPLRL